MKRWVKPARLRRRMADRRGFSLTELMAALLVLGMLTSLMAGGAMVVKNAYERMTLRTTAQLVLSTAVTAVTEELRWAADAPSPSRTARTSRPSAFTASAGRARSGWRTARPPSGWWRATRPRRC